MRTPVYLKINNERKKVGEIDEDTKIFHKTVNQKDHFFKKYQAWAMDANVFENIIRKYASFIELNDLGAKKLKYLYCNPNKIKKMIIDEFYPHGKQVFITMLDWKGFERKLSLKEIEKLFKDEVYIQDKKEVPKQESLFDGRNN